MCADPGIGSPKNIILVIGDGMGLSQISAAFYNVGRKYSLEAFPIIGFQKTYAANNLITDSAAAGTAIACGCKTKNNFIGVDPKGNKCESILEEAERFGLATGLVVTSSIQHATPASFFAHQPARNLYEDITLELLDSGIDLFIGGGKQHFERREKDERNLTQELKGKGFEIFDYFNNDLATIKPDTLKRFGYFTADKEPLSAIAGRDYLPQAATLAANFLKHRSPNGFFLMVEGSQIDWAGHSNKTEALYEEMEELDLTLQKLLEFARKDGNTLVIVTADHETGGLGLNRGTSNLLAPKFTTNGHTGVMVPVFAYGPKAELFRGIYENTEIHTKMQQAFGFSQN